MARIRSESTHSISLGIISDTQLICLKSTSIYITCALGVVERPSLVLNQILTPLSPNLPRQSTQRGSARVKNNLIDILRDINEVCFW